MIDDIVKAGVDGFLIDHTNDLKSIADKYGDSKAIIGKVDNYKFTYGSTEDVVSEVKRCVDEEGDCLTRARAFLKLLEISVMIFRSTM